MRVPRRHLPLAPLLRAYLDAGVPPPDELGPRCQAVRAARLGLLSEHFLDTAAEAEFQARVTLFYEATVQPPLHAETVRRRCGILRHALGHVVRCRDPLPVRL